METFEDKRQRLRIEFETQVRMEFKSLNLTINAKMTNISMNGIFVETDNLIDLNTPCHIEIIITAPHSRLTIETMGFVSRHDASGLGVKFKNDMEWFAFFSIFEYYGKRHPKTSDSDARHLNN